jgi:hypothetical protein
MGHKRKGQLAKSQEWAQHLRKIGRRIFWSRERMAEKAEIRKQLKDKHP